MLLCCNVFKLKICFFRKNKKLKTIIAKDSRYCFYSPLTALTSLYVAYNEYTHTAKTRMPNS